jgi:D-alanyl-D-alanine dipeptidase
MRKGIYDKLCRAISLLPEGYCFKVFDAWRPFEVQESLYNEYVDKLIKVEGVEVEIAKEKATCFVSKPSKDIRYPAVHSTGGAIDITIVDNNHNELNMGTEFDDFSILANTDAFENSDNEEVRRNRRLLYRVMTSVGFTNFPSEWWHYDYGDAFWAAQNGISFALYGGIYEI